MAVHQINWQRTRYVYDMHYKYKKVDKRVWDYCCSNKIIDENLAKKWRKPGYERLCSTYVINTRNYNFGTVSICRVPPSSLGESSVVECPTTGCRGCASSSDAPRNIFGNKYGQHLAGVQVRREEREEQKKPPRRDLGRRRRRRSSWRSAGPGVWAANDQDAYGDEGGGEKRRAYGNELWSRSRRRGASIGGADTCAAAASSESRARGRRQRRLLSLVSILARSLINGAQQAVPTLAA